MIDSIIDSIKGEVGRRREAYKDIAMHYAIEPPQGVKKKEMAQRALCRTSSNSTP